MKLEYCGKGIGLFLYTFLCIFVAVNSVTDLYGPRDHTVLLNNTNFEDTVLHVSNAWLVQFYNSWCGHCQDFVPSWKALAIEVIDWTHTIKLAVINCANENNRPICRDYSIVGYPTMKLFGAFLTKGDLGEPMLKRMVEEIQEEMINFVTEQERMGKGAQTWANLLEYEDSVENIFNYAPEEAVHSVLIVEEPSSLVASHVILDLGNYRMLYVRRMSKDSPNLREPLSSIPAVLVVDREGNIDTLKEVPGTREELTALIIHHLNLKTRLFDVAPKPDTVLVETPEEETVADKRPTGDTVYMVDIENTVRYIFQQEVSLLKETDGEALEALKNFVDVLVKYLPSRPKVHAFLVNLNNYLKTKDILHGEDFEKDLRSLQSADAMMPKQQPWKGCLGSEPKYRGYPCGLWTTFHTLTVNAALRTKHNDSYDPLEVMRAIHGYVKYFFGCDYCSNHFQEMYALDAESFVQRRNDEIVWLWKGHNKVNERLKDDVSEDPRHPKQQFPTRKNCPNCYTADGSFNIPKVITYLKELYGEESISLLGTKSLSPQESNSAALTPDTSGTSALFNYLAHMFLTGIAPLLNFYVHRN